MKNILILTILIICNPVCAFNRYLEKQEFMSLDATNGLISNEVTCIFQDSKGFIWLGTKNGLSKYDGYQCLNYKSNYLNPHFLSNNYITCITEDKENRLWVGTKNGLNIIDLPTNTTIELEDSTLKSTNINDIVISKDSTIFIACEEEIFTYSNQTLMHIELKRRGKDVAKSYINSLFIDSNEYLWISSWNNGYFVYDIKNHIFKDYHYLAEQTTMCTSFFEDRDNNIWISTWDKHGVFKITNPHQPEKCKTEQFIPLSRGKGFNPPTVFAINQDNNEGYIWLATSNGLQLINQEGTIEVYNKSNTNEILVNEIVSLYKDRSGIIWFSMLGAGVNSISFKRNQFTHFYLNDLLDQEYQISSVMSIYEDGNNNIWLGLRGFGLGIYNKTTNKIVLSKNHPQLKLMPKINAVLSFYSPHNKENLLFIGCRYEGLFLIVFDSSHQIVQEIKKISLKNLDSYANLGIISIKEDSKGHIWVATTEGIAKLVEKTPNNYITADIINFNKVSNKREQINCLLVDNQDNVWVGSDKGLYKNCHKQVELYSYQHKNLNSDDIITIHQDKKERIWVGTNGGGLSKYNPKTNQFDAIENIELLPNDVIYSIEEDKENNIWLSTGNGLVCYNESLPTGQRIKTFSSYDGLNIYTFNPNSSFKNNNDELLFGGSNGFISFSTPQLSDEKLSIPPIITNIRLNNPLLNIQENENWRHFLSVLPPYSTNISLPYKEKNLTIEFSTLAYDQPKAIKYAYKLEGVDKDWIYVDAKKRFANYSNLPSGKYTFSLKSSNRRSDWSKTIKFDIHIKPAPWKTWWAYTLYSLCFCLIISIIYRMIINRIKFKQILAKKQLEKEKAEEIYQSKMNFFTNISHDFFTPITVISCGLEGIENRNPHEVQMITAIKQNINRLIKLLEQVMEFKRIETGNDTITLSKLDVVAFLRNLTEVNFAPLQTQKGITLSFIPQKETIFTYIDTKKLDMIVYNLLSNAFKYNKENGKVSLIVNEIEKETYKYLSIIVDDTGIGMNEETQSNLFKQFYQGNKNPNIQSNGIGLYLTHNLIHKLGGNIQIKSTEGKGTRFYVELPADLRTFENIEYTVTELKTETTPEHPNLPTNKEKEEKNTDKQLSILIAEDNVDLLQMLTTSMSQHNIYPATNGITAIEILNKEKVDIIITDVVMPLMDGIEFTRTVKQNPKYSHIPILMLTARYSSDHKIQGFEAGADAYMTKPFDTKVLLANINSIMRNRQTTVQSCSKKTIEAINISQYAKNQSDMDFLEKSINFIEKNALSCTFTIDELYAELNMSQPTFYRKLQALTNLSPSELVRKVKMNIACTLLLQQNMSVADVCYSLGFNTPKHFSAMFKKEIGLTPTEYIKQNLK